MLEKSVKNTFVLLWSRRMPCFRIPVEFERILGIPVDSERSLIGTPIPKEFMKKLDLIGK